MAEIISGKEISKIIKKELTETIADMKKDGMRAPCLAVVLVGEHPASMSYVRGKHKACSQVGIISKDLHLSETISQEELLQKIEELNSNPEVDGILVQLPLPKHISEEKVIQLISPEKDVDGFHPVNLGRMMTGIPSYLPCTPNGILELLRRSGISTESKNVCIVGRSNIVGKPLANMLMQKNSNGNATVTVCHSRTKNISQFTRDADIVVAAIGKADFLTKDMIKKGAVVIDVGINRIEDASKKRGYRLKGDVNYDDVFEKASCITPVPGGVGPMTIAMLMVNTLDASKKHQRGEHA